MLGPKGTLRWSKATLRRRRRPTPTSINGGPYATESIGNWQQPFAKCSSTSQRCLPAWPYLRIGLIPSRTSWTRPTDDTGGPELASCPQDAPSVGNIRKICGKSRVFCCWHSGPPYRHKASRLKIDRPPTFSDGGG